MLILLYSIVIVAAQVHVFIKYWLPEINTFKFADYQNSIMIQYKLYIFIIIHKRDNIYVV